MELSSEYSLDRFFNVVQASTPDLLDLVYALRYQVYCVENSFEDPNRFPNGRECDGYDPFSKHVALVYRSTLEVVGTVRLIIPTLRMTPSLPLLGLMSPSQRVELSRYPLDRMAEISRYAIAKSFRRRKDEDEVADLGYANPDVEGSRRLMPHLTLGLMRGILSLGVAQQVEYFCGCMRPALLRLLGQFGLIFSPIGNPVNHHGLRQPCMASLDDLLQGLKTHREEYYRVVRGYCLKTATPMVLTRLASM